MTFIRKLAALALGGLVSVSPLAVASVDAQTSQTEASTSVSRTPSRSTRAVGMTGHFRMQVVLQCSNGSCSANGSAVPSEDWYDVIHNVSCYASVANNGQFIDLKVDVQGFMLDVPVQWERKTGTTTRYTFGKAADLWIDTGKRARVIGKYAPANAPVSEAYCLFTGEYLE